LINFITQSNSDNFFKLTEELESTTPDEFELNFSNNNFTYIWTISEINNLESFIRLCNWDLNTINETSDICDIRYIMKSEHPNMSLLSKMFKDSTLEDIKKLSKNKNFKFIMKYSWGINLKYVLNKLNIKSIDNSVKFSFTSENNVNSCEATERENMSIFLWKSRNFTLILENWKLLWFIKRGSEKSFTSLVNRYDKNWKLIFTKKMTYYIDWFEEIIKHNCVDIESLSSIKINPIRPLTLLPVLDHNFDQFSEEFLKSSLVNWRITFHKFKKWILKNFKFKNNN